MIGGTSWIGSSYEVVYMSAVILLHQVCDAFGCQKWTPQSQSDSCCMQYSSYLNMFLHHMYYAQISMYAALLT